VPNFCRIFALSRASPRLPSSHASWPSDPTASAVHKSSRLRRGRPARHRRRAAFTRHSHLADASPNRSSRPTRSSAVCLSRGSERRGHAGGDLGRVRVQARNRPSHRRRGHATYAAITDPSDPCGAIPRVLAPVGRDNQFGWPSENKIHGDGIIERGPARFGSASPARTLRTRRRTAAIGRERP
jgi:hypothetical protein